MWQAAAAAEEEESDGLDDEQKELAERIIKERKLVKAKRDLEKTNNKPAVPRPGRVGSHPFALKRRSLLAGPFRGGDAFCLVRLTSRRRGN